MGILKKLFKRKQVQQADEPLVLVFVPALAAVLKAAEDEKGAPLGESEVLAVRDRATCIAVTYSTAADMEAERGYPDIVAEDAWAEWNWLRGQL